MSREWAEDVKYEDPQEFLREFVKRHPSCGGNIPTRDGYLGAYVKPEPEPVPVMTEEVEEYKPKMVNSRDEVHECVCGRKIKSKVGYISHRNNCKVARG